MGYGLGVHVAPVYGMAYPMYGGYGGYRMGMMRGLGYGMYYWSTSESTTESAYQSATESASENYSLHKVSIISGTIEIYS